MMVLVSASPARAQGVLWVSATGNDANACTPAAPCATFQGAINKGGVSQINCLNSGNYGAFIITASITVDCGAGNVGNIVVFNHIAIQISTTSAATIVLRHLNLNGLDASSFGIVTETFPSGTLIVEDCVVHGFQPGNTGIFFGPTAGRGLLQISNSQIFDNANGIEIEPQNGQVVSLMLNRVELTGNSFDGLVLASNGVIAGTMRDSLVAANGASGVVSTASQVFFTIEGSSIIDNLSAGIATDSAGTFFKVGGSTIGGNGTGLFFSAGSIVSFGNNQMSDNGSNGNFSSTVSLR
jgi:hypothetical protein